MIGIDWALVYFTFINDNVIVTSMHNMQYENQLTF